MNTSYIVYIIGGILISLGSAAGRYIYQVRQAKHIKDTTLNIEKFVTLINDLTSEVDDKIRLTIELKNDVNTLKDEVSIKASYIDSLDIKIENLKKQIEVLSEKNKISK